MDVAPIATEVVCFSRLLKRLKASMANIVDPDQTAPIGAVSSGSTLFASILNSSVNAIQLFAADDFSRRHFQMHFFLGALRVNPLPHRDALNRADTDQQLL